MTSTLPLSSPTTPLPYSKSRTEGRLSNELYNANPTALRVSLIKKITLAGDVVKDDEFDLGVLRDGELRYLLHHIMTGKPSRGTMAH